MKIGALSLMLPLIDFAARAGILRRRLLLLLLLHDALMSSRGAHAPTAIAQTTESTVQAGVSLLQQKRYEEARRELESAAMQHADSAEAFFYLGMAELHLGDRLAAEASLRRSLELDPRAVNTLYNLGVLLLDDKKPSQAIPYLEQAN